LEAGKFESIENSFPCENALKTSIHFLWFLLLISPLVSCGQSKARLVDGVRPGVSPGVPFPSSFASFEIGRSVENRVIECIVAGEGDENIMFMATIHGNESAGTSLVLDLMEYIRGNPRIIDGKRLILLPIANPDGFFRNIRYNVNGVDLNRNFPASNRINNATFGEKPLSEPESIALIQVIHHFFPDRIISIHEPLNCIDYDGPAIDLAYFLADHTDLEVRKLGSRPGSLGSYTGEELQIPTITLELPPEAGAMSRAQLWSRYGTIMLAMIFYAPDMVLGK
jgi:murein peptide amidase A